jgi:DNA polymerase kappa
MNTQYLKSHEDMTPDDVAEQIRNEVLSKTKISISAGIAPNAMVI